MLEDVIYILLYIERETCSLIVLSGERGGGIIFARGKFEFKLFLNDLWYEHENLWLFFTFARDYFAAKKIAKNIILSGSNIFLYRGYCQQIGVWIYRSVGVVIVTEINMYMYKKLLVLNHLLLSKDYVAHFADQVL